MSPLSPKLQPPIAKKQPHHLEAHGLSRTDDYYWMRDDERKNTDVLNYLKAENSYTEAILEPYKECQTKLYTELVKRIPGNDSSVPYQYHGYWYARRYEAELELPLHVRWANNNGEPSGEPEVLLDENKLKGNSDFFEVGDYDISPNGKQLAWTEDRVSRGIYTLNFRDLKTHINPPFTISHIGSEIVFANDNLHVFYLKLQDETLIPWQVWCHRLGTDPSNDELVYQEDDPTYFISIGRGRDDRYISIDLSSTTTTETWLIDADRPNQKPRLILARKTGHEYSIETLGEWIYILTNENARNFKLVRTKHGDINDHDTWQIVIPESTDALLSDFIVFKQHLITSQIINANQRLTVMQLDGSNAWVIASDSPAYEMAFNVNMQSDSHILRYTEDTPIQPTRWYEIDLISREKTLLKQQFAGSEFDSTQYIVKRIDATARDGMSIPVTLVYQRNLDTTQPQPLYQLGYGSYGISYLPGFFRDMYSLIDRGFIFALAHIRGGQEKGRAWYENGRLLNKKNTFNDFIDVTQHLQAINLTTPALTVASGRSAGGLLMGAVVNQAPTLYQVIIAGVPFVDVVTTMLDASIPLTTFEYDEWGNPEHRQYYDYMLSYSPYDQVSAQDYPNIYVGTGLWDPAVQYWEPAKWVAKLRQTKTDDNALLMFTDMNAGHRGGAGRYARQKDTAREMAFILSRIEHKTITSA